MSARKPLALAIATGNPGRRPLNTSEPQYTALMDAKPPSWLQGDARREFKRIVPELAAQGLLTAVDLVALSTYCHLWQMYADLARALKDHKSYTYSSTSDDLPGAPRTMHRPRPEAALLLEVATKMRAYASEFGFTPASRTRVHGCGPPDELDPLEAALFGAGAAS